MTTDKALEGHRYGGMFEVFGRRCMVMIPQIGNEFTEMNKLALLD